MYALELANKQRGSFLFLYGDQDAAQAARLLRACDPPPEVVICARAYGEGWQYFILPTHDARLWTRLQAAPEGQTTAEALRDVLGQPAACLRGSDPVSSDAAAFVVEEGGMVLGYVLQQKQPPHSTGLEGLMGVDLEPRPGDTGQLSGRDFIGRDAQAPGNEKGEQPSGAEPGGAQRPVERYLQTETPEGLVVGEEGDLLVWITCRPDESGFLRLISSLDLEPGEVLDVIVRAEAGLALTGQSYGRLSVPNSEADSKRLRIGLRAVQAGLGRLKVYCMHRGVSLGCIALSLMIYRDEAEARQAQAGRHALVLPPLTAGGAPTLTLWVFEERANDQPALRYLLHDAKSGLPAGTYGPLLLDEAPRERFSRSLAEVEALLRSTSTETVEDTRVEMQMRGELLFQELFPPELQELLARRQDEIESIHILSQEAWIPWEMVRVYGMDAAGTMHGRYLCEYLLTRWNPDYPPQSHLSLESIGVISPGAAEEMNFLNLLKDVDASSPNTYEITYLPDGMSELVTELMKGNFTCLHFSGYQRSMDEILLRSGIVLEKGRLLYAQNFAGTLQTCCKRHPLVFLNTSRSQPDAPRLTGLDGWANQFLAIGAAAFVGTHWSVSDEAASLFGSQFYSSLLLGEPVGVALREARTAVREQLPTLDWLAYAGFSDPAMHMPETLYEAKKSAKTG